MPASAPSSSALTPVTLAFPPLGVAGGLAFDAQRAATTAAAELAAFLSANASEERLRLLLVLDEADPQQAAFRAHFEAAVASEPVLQGDEHRLQLRGGSLLALRSQEGVTATCLANAANHRLSSKGGGANKALHIASPALEAATKAAHPGGERDAGQAFAVRLPDGCPLRASQGVEWVVHTVAPNMNPAKPKDLKGDYEVGCRQLAATYRALLHEFKAVVLG